jgi:hypothetical protein
MFAARRRKAQSDDIELTIVRQVTRRKTATLRS